MFHSSAQGPEDRQSPQGKSGITGRLERQLRRERGLRQVELYREYQQQISDHVKQELAPELEAWRQDLPQKRDAQKADAAAQKTEAEKRNAEAMQKQMEKVQMVQQRLEKRKELAAKRRELNKIKKRVSEIDDLILKIYEDNVSHKISDERFEMFSKRYEDEQQELKAKIPELEAYLSAETDKTESVQKFIAKVKKVTSPTELTPELVNEFIEKIVVSSPHYLDGKRDQLIDVHYKGVGIINIQTPEEFEKGFQAKMKQRRQKSA